MSSEQKVAVITGASQGIGASLVKAYRDLGYGVVANSRSIKASDFGTPTPSYMDAKGNLSAADYLTQPAARATRFSSLITQRQGAVAYVAEVFVPVPNFNFYATSGGTPGVFARAIF